MNVDWLTGTIGIAFVSCKRTTTHMCMRSAMSLHFSWCLCSWDIWYWVSFSYRCSWYRFTVHLSLCFWAHTFRVFLLMFTIEHWKTTGYRTFGCIKCTQIPGNCHEIRMKFFLLFRMLKFVIFYGPDKYKGNDETVEPTKSYKHGVKSDLFRSKMPNTEHTKT